MILIGQVLLVFGLAGTVFVVIPPEVYLLVGILVALVVAILMYQIEAANLEVTLGFVATTIMISMLFGTFWPALPAIAVWGGVMRRRAEQQARDEKDNPPPSPQPGP